MISYFTKYFSGHEMKENEAGCTCDTYGREENAHKGLVGKHGARRLLGKV